VVKKKSRLLLPHQHRLLHLLPLHLLHPHLTLPLLLPLLPLLLPLRHLLLLPASKLLCAKKATFGWLFFGRSRRWRAGRVQRDG
jgi:hypothetical protein